MLTLLIFEIRSVAEGWTQNYVYGCLCLFSFCVILFAYDVNIFLVNKVIYVQGFVTRSQFNAQNSSETG
jgi:hypothetical protein